MRHLLPIAGLFLCAAAEAAPALLPRPAELVEGKGSFALSAATPVIGDRVAATAFADLMKRTTGVAPAGATGPAIRFVRDSRLGTEAYAIEATAKGVTVRGGDAAGLYYGAVTLWQLATQPGAEGRIESLVIRDKPRFAWRGMMLDSARHFQSPAFIKRFIEWMAVNKLNRFHWHLVDDQGWRLEIRKYPKLTEVSAWRTPASVPGAPALPRTGGFYTQAEVRDIVAFAAARGVMVIPEIEMPGHALAAIKAYPQLGTGAPVPPGVESDWGVFPWLYNVEEPTFGFLEDVLTEVIALFPSPYIHVGGDEATKEQWRASPAVQARMKALGITSEDKLQGWFVARIGAYLAKHNRKLIGWDEILDGGVPASATVMSWRGIDGAVKAARAGHDAVLAPAPTLYFDHRQGNGAYEPPGRGLPVTLFDVQGFDPEPKDLTAAERRHILGLQGQVWTEHVRTEERVAWMAFPRAMAVAETGWSGAQGGQGDFIRRVAAQARRMEPFGLRGATSTFAGVHPPPPNLRESAGLTTCSAKLDLFLEDDFPAQGPRAKFLIDILDPCWKWSAAPMDGVGTIELAVGQIPFNFQVGKDRDAIKFGTPTTTAGEFEVRAGRCDGPPLATLPLAPAAGNPGVTVLRAKLPALKGAQDLCVRYTAKGPDPLWAIDRIALLP